MNAYLVKRVENRSKSEENNSQCSREFESQLKVECVNREVDKIKKQNVYLKEQIKLLEQRLQCLEQKNGLVEYDESFSGTTTRKRTYSDDAVVNAILQLDLQTSDDKEYIFMLNEDMFMKIFSFLSTRDLFALRQTSRKMKNYVELWLQSEKELNVKSEFVTLEHVNLLSTLYSNIKSLTIRSVIRLERQSAPGFIASFPSLIYLWKDKFPKLEWLKVRDSASRFNSVDICLIGDTFVNLTALTLSSVKISEEVVSHLFRRLRSLQHVEMENVPIRGQCFADLSTTVRSVCWSTSDLDLNDDLYFSTKPNELKSFAFNSIGDKDGQKIIGLIMREMPNLQYLRLEVLFGVQYFDDLNLTELKEFELRVSEIYGSYSLYRPMLSVKKLSLAVHRICDTNLATLLSNFPNIEFLSLDFSENSRFQFSSKVVESLCNLHSLKSFLFKDASNFRDQYLLLNGRQNAVVEAIEALTFVSKFTIELNFSRNEAFCFSILCNIEAIAARRPNDWFCIHLLRGQRIDRKFPVNMIVEFEDY